MVCCCCYRKGTNFQANHNELPDIRRQPAVVVATAKVQIFKQITTRQCKDSTFVSCCCYRKGTNFQANHNYFRHEDGGVQLLLLPQRYKFSSKSQQELAAFRALCVVVATAKVQIFKQITTNIANLKGGGMLLLLPQRYKFSSKSQRITGHSTAAGCCCCYRKGTNFQANHNKTMQR